MYFCAKNNYSFSVVLSVRSYSVFLTCIFIFLTKYKIELISFFIFGILRNAITGRLLEIPSYIAAFTPLRVDLRL